MAISFTRPDPASPASVSAAQFPVSRRGYDQAEVRDFLRMVAAEQARLQERERSLERDVKALQQASTSPITAMDEDTATRLLGEEAARVLQAAREGAAQIRARAEESSARLLREATDEAQRLREEAEIEAARRRQDAAADSESELQMAKQQGRDMVNEARAYRERVLSELARRRELARQQIEQLIHGRDRLLQAFERSRIAAVEVMAELTPLGEPDEYVNLSPTTGPVPIMVPAAPRPVRPNPYVLTEAVEPDIGVEPVVSDATIAIDRVLELHDGTDVDQPTAVDLDADTDADVDADIDDEVTTPEYEVDGSDTVTNVVSLPEVVTDADTDESRAADDAREPAEVVSLFAGELDSPVVVDTTPADTPVVAAEPAAEPATAEDANPEPAIPDDANPEDANPDAATSVATGVATVGDLFARLRAARAEVVVARAIEHVHQAEAAVAAESAAATPPEMVIVGEELDPPIVEATADDDAGPSPEEIVVPIILSAARRLKRVLADEQNEVLDTLRRKEPVRALDTLLPWEADHSGRYAKAVEADLITAATAGAVGGDDGANPAIIRPALDAVTNEIVAPLRDRLIRCIDKAAGDNVELGNQVRVLYREWKTHRIDEHVEDIVRLAYDRGALTVTSR